MVLYTTNQSTGEAEKTFSKDNVLLTTNWKYISGETTVAISGNSASTVKIDCSSFKSIRFFGEASIDRYINLSYSDALDGAFRVVDDKLNMTTINSVHTFSLELNNIPNYISFYNNNSSSTTLTLNYVLYS